MMMTFRKSIKV